MEEEIQDDEFKQTGLVIVILKSNLAIWTLREGSPDDIYVKHHDIRIGAEITIKETNKYTVSDVWMVKRVNGWQVNIKVE